MRTAQPAGDERPPPCTEAAWPDWPLGALGVVFGDIGTSPLYSGPDDVRDQRQAVQPTVDDVYGIVSLIFWSSPSS